MQTARWLTFALANSITKTVVHFFPGGSVTTAPYPANVQLTVFGKDLPAKTIALEGSRLGQPDGVRLHDAFPFLAEGYQGYLALQVEMSTSQARVDMSGSACVVEITSSGQTVKFMPKLAGSSGDRNALLHTAPLHTVACMNDAFCSTSLLIVNSGGETYRPSVSAFRPGSADPVPAPCGSEAVLPGTAVEIPFTDSFYDECEPVECTWGLSRSRIAVVGGELRGDGAGEQARQDISVSVLYKDTLTRRITSVLPL